MPTTKVGKDDESVDDREVLLPNEMERVSGITPNEREACMD